MFNFNNFQKLRWHSVLVCLAFSLFGACEPLEHTPKPDEDISSLVDKNGGGSGLSDTQSLERLKQIAFILTEMIKTPIIKQEVMDGVNAKIYDDENIFLKDLLYPQSSTIFSSRANQIQFDDRFLNVFNARTYLQASNYSSISYNDLLNFILKDDVAIYAPYSENWDGRSLPTLTWNTIESRNDNQGYKPVLNSSGNIIRFDLVTVDDDYADRNLVWIVKFNSRGGVRLEEPDTPIGGGPVSSPPDKDGDEPFDCNDFQDSSKIYQVRVGYVRVVDQLDPFFGFNNSGGAEIVMVRSKVKFLPVVNPDPQEDWATIPLAKIKRRDIKKKNWVRYDVDYESNWKPNETQYVIGCYEYDRTGAITISGTAKTKVKILGADVELSLQVSANFTSENLVQYNVDWDRCTYLRLADEPSVSSRGGLVGGWRIFQGQYTDFSLPYTIY